MNLIETRNLTYTYEDDQLALKNITTTIKKGEKIAVVGSNGAGKSTFFLTLNGILKVDKGSLLYKDEIIEYKKKQMIELRKNIGIIFQDPDSQIVAQTVFHEIAFGIMNLSVGKDETRQKVNAMIEKMELTDMAQKAPHYLSGGQKKRVTIADILIMEPELILFDEPTASLDPLNVKKLKSTLTELFDQGITLMISTHDMEFAYEWADRIMVFHGGEIIADGTPEKVFEQKELLEKANIAQPVLYQIYQSLKQAGKIESNIMPRNVTDMIKLIEK